MGWLGQILGTSPGSDEDAMRRVRTSADPAAFAALVRRWQGPITRLCIRMTGPDRGENLAQESFVRVLARRHQFLDGRKFSTWLWQISLNLCREELRNAARRGEVAIGERDFHAATPGPAEHAEAHERAALVQSALAALPDGLREIVILREYENLTFREIAEILDLPEGTVKWRMADALNDLRRALGRTLDEPPRPVAKQSTTGVSP